MRFRFLLVFLIIIAFVPSMTGQTKISGTLQCSKPDPVHSIGVGDRPNHALVVSKNSCTWPKALEMAGSQTKDGISVQSEETSGGKGNARGVHWGTMASGDKYFVRFQGTSAYKDGAFQSAEGTWSYTGGTGKLKGLKGKGTYKSKANADGTSSVDIEGDYKLP